MQDSLVIVPTYNEAENIRALLLELTAEDPRSDILVVDDNSPDGTRNIVQAVQRREPRVHLLNRSGKQGLSAAYQAGFQWGLERPYRRIIQMDADFSHRPTDVPRLLEALDEVDVAIGCRYIDGGGTSGWSMIRQLISRGGNLYAQAVLALPYHDLTGGFNGWRREVLERIDLSTLKSKGYAFQVELKYRAFRRGYRLAEVPIHFENRRLGQSKMSGQIVWEAAFRVFQMKRSPSG